MSDPEKQTQAVATDNLIGTQLGTYEIQALLGSGGMARVYRGVDHNLGRPVAIKVLSEAVATQPGVAARFQQEARLLASLCHPHIVAVYDFGEQDGHTYMVQELLPGPTLEQRLCELAAQGARPTRPEVVTIVAQLASALDAAHAAGIIHRDVKPSNALWNSVGSLVLTDFGIAKHTFTPRVHTQIGLVMGTPTYLSPEQAQEQPLTPASDIYALGVVLYELIAGTVPFTGGAPMAIVMQHVHAPPPAVRRQRPDVPVAVEAVVHRALAKDPAARFRTAGKLAQALEQAWPAPPMASSLLPSPDRYDRTTIHPGTPAIAAAAPRQRTTPLRALFAAVLRAYAGRRPLPIRAGLLTVLLLCSALLALRSVAARADVRETQTPAPTATALSTATAIVQPTATATALPTATPAPPPTATAAPQPSIAPVAPAPAPVAAPAAPPVAEPAAPAGLSGDGQGRDERGKGHGKGKGQGKGKGHGKGK